MGVRFSAATLRWLTRPTIYNFYERLYVNRWVFSRVPLLFIVVRPCLAFSPSTIAPHIVWVRVLVGSFRPKQIALPVSFGVSIKCNLAFGCIAMQQSSLTRRISTQRRSVQCSAVTTSDAFACLNVPFMFHIHHRAAQLQSAIKHNGVHFACKLCRFAVFPLASAFCTMRGPKTALLMLMADLTRSESYTHSCRCQAAHN